MRWRDQPAIAHHCQAHVELSARGRELAVLASSLAKVAQIHFDLESWDASRGGERYLFVPGLGLRRLELDSTGETMIRAGAVESAVQDSGGSVAELRRRLDLLLGKPWLALLEPLQTAAESPRLVFLPRSGSGGRVTAT